MKLYIIKNEHATEIVPNSDYFLEKDIEDFIQKNSNVLLNEPILIFGRQVHTSTGKILDLLALDKYGRIIIIELKRGIAPRDMMAQILDYSSWLKKLSERELDNIARNYFSKNDLPFRNLHTAFEDFFKVENAPVIGSELVNVLFAQEYPIELVNAVSYLSDSGVPIYLLKFNKFKDSNNLEYILIEKLNGEEEDNENVEHVEKQSTKNIGMKSAYRQLFNKIKKSFETDYLDWANQFDAEWKGFIVFQSRSGDWISIRGEWRVPEGSVQFAFGLSLDENDKYLMSRIAFPKNFNTTNLDELLLSIQNNDYKESEPRTKNNFWKKLKVYSKIFEPADKMDDSFMDENFIINYVKDETPLLIDFIENMLLKK